MKKKRFVGFMICLALMLTLLPGALTITAEATDVIEIATKAGLAGIGISGNYKLTADIDLSGADWTPIAAFSGTLDGDGHKISNLAITDTTGNSKGLFASIENGGSVTNLGIVDANITAGNDVGIIAASNAGTISRCYTTGTVSGGSNVGGLVGTNSGTIENCYSRASVSGNSNLGGLVGSNSGTVSTSYAASTVTDSVLNNYLKFNAAAHNGSSYTSGGYVSIPNTGNYKTDAFTLEAWFQVDSTGLAFIISKSGTAVADTEWFEIHTSGDGLRFIPIPNGNISTDTNAYGGDTWIDVKDVLQDGWFHVAAVYWYDSTAQEAHAQVYVNGEAQEIWRMPSEGADAVNVGKTATIKRSSNPLANTENSFPINIGRRGDNSLYFDGKIADVRFWNTARTADEIKANKDKVLTGTEAGLVGYWKLNDELDNAAIGGAQVADSTANNNQGTIYGTVAQTKESTATSKGALVGSNTSTVEKCYYDLTIYGSDSGGEGTAKTTTEMKTQSTYTETDWKDTSIWQIADGSYPVFYQYDTPNATFDATGYDTGTLSNVTDKMQYSVDSGANWTYITGTPMSITGVGTTNGVQIKQPGNGVSHLTSEVQTINVTQAPAPSAPTRSSRTADSITLNAATNCEYSKDGTNWQDSAMFTGLDEKTSYTFYQRVAAAGTCLASAASEGVSFTTLSATAAGTVSVGTVTLADGQSTTVYGGTASYSDGVLTLDGVTVSDGHSFTVGSYNFSAAIYADGDLTIETVNANSVTGADGSSLNGSTYGIYVDGNLTVSNTGSLTATSGSARSSYGAWVKNKLTVTSGSLTAVSSVSSSTTTSVGVNADSVEVKEAGSLTATANTAQYYSNGVEASKGTTISGGSLTATSGTSASLSCKALTSKPTVTGNYKYKTSTAASEPTGTYTRSRVTPITSTYNKKYLKILPDPSVATIGDVTISGTADTPISDKTITITLENDTFKAVAAGSVTWVAGLPTGLTQNVADVSAGATTATITISGTPTTASGAQLEITIPADSLTSYADLPVNKKINLSIIPATPSAPTLSIRTADSITLNTVTGYEYSKDGDTWQDSAEFTGLSASSSYTFYQRVKASGTCAASGTSAALSVTTKSVLSGVTVNMSGYTYGVTPPAPTLSNYDDTDVTYYYGTVNQSTGGTEWKNITATSLNAGTYYMYATIAETDDRMEFTTPAVAFTVSKVTLTPSVTSVTGKVYDGSTDATGTLSLEGAVSGQAPTATGTFKWVSANAETTEVNVTNITLGSGWTTNYELSSESLSDFTAPGDAKITNASLTGVSVTGYSGTYDGAAHDADASKAATAVNSQPLTWKFGTDGVTYDQDRISVQNVSDSKTVYYKVSAPNHADKTGSATVTITPKELTAVWLGENKSDTDFIWVYDGDSHAPTATAITGVDSETVTLSVSGAATNYSASDYTATASIVGNSNYTLTNTTEGFSITPRPATLTWAYDSPFAFTGEPQTVTATVSNAVGLDTVTLEYSDNSKTAAGSYTAKVTALGNDNYTLTGATGATQSWVIQKAPVSFTVADNSYTYNAAAHTATVTQTASETPSVAGKFTVSYQKDSETATTSKTDAGSYDIIVTLTDANFKFDGQADTVRSFKVGTLTIDQKSITALWKNLSHVYDGNTKAPTFNFIDTDIETDDSGNVSAVLSGEGGKRDAGSYPVSATLTGDRAHNYQLTNPNGSFIIQRAPVSFTLSGNSVKQGDSVNVIATPSITGVIATLTYWQNGKQVSTPTDAGSYDIYAEISNANYRHAGAADGAARKIGVLTIYRVSPPATYTVSFEGGTGATGATDALAAAQAGTSRVLAACGFTVDGKTFTGWKYNGSVYQPDERLSQPAANIILTAQWAENVYAIAGLVDQDDTPLTDVVVTLMLGSRQIGQVTTDDGNYRFANVLPGLYNLVASKNGVTQTILVEIVAADETGKNITMPSGKTNSVVEVTAGSPPIVVGNLEQTFETPDENNPCYKPEDADVVAGGGTVEIKLTASAKTVTQDADTIEEAASGTVGLYLDMTLTKTVTEAGKPAAAPERLTEAAALLEMVINLPGELQRKDSYTVYRTHDGQVHTLTATPNKDGEYISVNVEKTAITVYAKFFSSYAVAYTTYSYSGDTGYKPVVAAEHGTVTVTPTAPYYGTTVTITATPDTGYQLGSLVVTDSNGNAVTLTEKPDGTFTFTQPRGSVTVKASFRLIVGMPFTDVTERDWFHDDVRYVYENGLMQGTGDTTFSPQLTTTRGMIVTILYRLEEEPAISGDCPFSDAEAGKYYERAIVWAASNHIVEGYGNGKFGPEDPITREQMAAILYRYATYKGYDVSATADLGRFTDEGNISDYARTAMQWANANEIVNGRDGNTLDPRGYALRSQVAAIVHRFYEKLVMPQGVE